MRAKNGEGPVSDRSDDEPRSSKRERQPLSADATLQPQRTAPLAEPVVISEFWANRRGETVRVQLREYEGHALIDVRKHFTNGEGQLQATKKGISIAVTRLPELAAAINKALAKAIELGLIDGGDGCHE